MKKILVLLMILLPSLAFGQASKQDLIGLGMSAELADALSLGITAKDGYTILVDNDVNRKFTFNASSDTSLVLGLGDSSVTALQEISVRPTTADADDDAKVYLSGGGSASETRGSYIVLQGEEASGGGDLYLWGANGDEILFGNGSSSSWKLNTLNDWASISSGTTLSLQEATPGAACSGTATTNGTTAVTVSTTCATTGSRIFLSRTADATGTAANDQSGCWATNIVNATSFDIDCSDTGDNGAMNWLIIHEAP